VTNGFLHSILTKTCPARFYGGVFAADEIKRFHLSVGGARKGFIVNLNPRRKKEGGHFVCIISEKHSLLYLDPVGLPCLVKNLSEELKQSGKQVFFNSQQIQAVNSKACGLFSILFLLYFSAGENGMDFKMEFDTKQKLKNDQLCLNYLKKIVDETNFSWKQLFPPKNV